MNLPATSYNILGMDSDSGHANCPCVWEVAPVLICSTGLGCRNVRRPGAFIIAAPMSCPATAPIGGRGLRSFRMARTPPPFPWARARILQDGQHHPLIRLEGAHAAQRDRLVDCRVGLQDLFDLRLVLVHLRRRRTLLSDEHALDERAC